MNPTYHDIDRRIWTEELATFVPARVFDFHTHLYLAEHWRPNPPHATERPRYFDTLGDGLDLEAMRAWSQALLPGREGHYFLMGFPWPKMDFEGANAFIAEEVARDPLSRALMLVHPGMAPSYVAEQIERHGFAGLKPYRLYSVTDDVDECRITDFMPEDHFAVADEHGLVTLLHISKRGCIADPENIEDVQRLCAHYPNMKLVLAHVARGWVPVHLEQALSQLKGIPNLWYDTAAVTESDVFSVLLDVVGHDRLLYGSDSVVGFERGREVAIGLLWTFITGDNFNWQQGHGTIEPTYHLYEQLRAMRWAARWQRLSPAQVEDIFWGNAVRLLNLETAT